MGEERRAELARALSGIKGEVHTGKVMRTLYATDASAYQEMPQAVVMPKDAEDVAMVIAVANRFGMGIIPRAAGTSLAGQVVGNGIVVDVSRHMTEILEVNVEERWAWVQPGVIRNELNMALAGHGLMFGPETSTQNRAMIGGMLGNNSCGSNSLVYGSTRDHTLEVKGFLSDGSAVHFGDLDRAGFAEKCDGPDDTLERRIYRGVREILGDPQNRAEIREGFPKPSIPRRNTGYALDLLMDCAVFEGAQRPFNMCRLIAGSEGTLFFATEIKVNLVPLPPRECGLLCAHFATIDESLRANLIALKYGPSACELIDHYILECTKASIEHRKNRFFVKGDPGAILVVEIRRDTRAEVEAITARIADEMRAAGFGYHYPVLYGDDTNRIWELRKAGLGLLSNIPGDDKPVPVIEDTAVEVTELPEYIREFNEIMAKRGLSCVHYAHAGSGEIHMRPILNLKTEEGNRLFREVARDVAALVKRYRGSLSGEHGDGRLRGEFLEFMIGPKNYAMVVAMKDLWDPQRIFNPNKIVDTPPMNSSLRYKPGQATPMVRTVQRFDQTRGILRMAEMCNGSGDCRKTHLSGGTMCPSYMATRNEKDTTRARANMLRNVLTHSDQANPFDSDALKDVLDLCLSCKGCKSECPSSVDIAKMKAEFLQGWYDANGIPLRTRLIAGFTRSSALASLFPPAWNFMMGNRTISTLIKKAIGFAPQRSMPKLQEVTLRRWMRKRAAGTASPRGKVYLFCDEFTNFNDTHVGIRAVELLETLGYEVVIPEHGESARTQLSKGLLRRAQRAAVRNVRALAPLVSADTPLVGIEPSAILGFRDEYLDLVPDNMRASAEKLAENCLMFDEFIMREADAGRIDVSVFTDAPAQIRLHGHCHQKAVASVVPTKRMLELPPNYKVRMIPSGCCGMAGSFGYEKEHYTLSMQIGELVLFPTVRTAAPRELIAAPGTSCRHQIKDGTGVEAHHPIEILHAALRSSGATAGDAAFCKQKP